ncbi:MAG TPA: BPTI/Kunitz-type proteinase inhibitor domain-containing protein [Polyangiaceae bacterium]|nr:BPTI/Kunitz-type proteinase inhibitor domain-containing protein [Polyangiaceae bacterium]
MKTIRTWLMWAGLVVAACGGASSGSSNSETHFLGLCAGDGCGDGLSCICGVCTVTCDPAASCGALNAKAICKAPSSSSSSCDDDTQPSVCDVDCENDSECASLGSDYRCQAGVCRPPGCVAEGRVYEKGETFDVDCNTCSCGANGAVRCTLIDCGSSCEYDGKSYDVGEDFPATDGCNTCSCSEDGVLCSEIGCEGNTCEYDGTTYDIGEEFPATDGCNTCSCSASGVACTDAACAGNTCEYDGTTYDIGEEFPATDGCNTCSCTADGVACTDAACAGCRVGDRWYDFGETYLAEDGCNTCTCDENGGGCTERACSAPECLLPFESGDCLAFVPVFHYNPETFRCEEQVYGGCGGNDNRFDTLEACQERCPEIDNGD